MAVFRATVVAHFLTTTKAFLPISTLSPTLSISSRTRPFIRRQWPCTSMSAMTKDNDKPSSAHDSVGGDSLLLFDFDGVVCDSCDECTVAALRTCREMGLVPNESLPAENNDDEPPRWLFEGMRDVRPAIEVGWQIPVILAAYLDRSKRVGEKAKLTDRDTDEILRNYEQIVQESLKRWEKSESDMVEAFGSVRDRWMAEDLNSWLEINSFYKGIPETLNGLEGREAAVVTTKQQRFAIALVRHARVTPTAIPDSRILGLGMYGSKADVIADFMARGGHAPENTHFFEDRWPTIAKCLKDERLLGVRFYLCSWGYVTSEELALGHANPRVEVLDLESFRKVVGAL